MPSPPDANLTTSHLHSNLSTGSRSNNAFISKLHLLHTLHFNSVNHSTSANYSLSKHHVPHVLALKSHFSRLLVLNLNSLTALSTFKLLPSGTSYLPTSTSLLLPSHQTPVTVYSHYPVISSWLNSKPTSSLHRFLPSINSPECSHPPHFLYNPRTFPHMFLVDDGCTSDDSIGEEQEHILSCPDLTYLLTYTESHIGSHTLRVQRDHQI